MKRAIICLAEGFEEIEAIVPIDLLRRAGVDVVIAGVGDSVITGSRGVTIKTDGEIASYADLDADCMLLPGGLPGATNLAASWDVNNRLIRMFNDGKIIAAICAAPAAVLGRTGILEGRRATCYPGAESLSPGSQFVAEPVVVDGNLITAQGPGLAADFALAVITALVGTDKADEVKGAALF